MKKVMFVIGTLSGGGAERVVTSVASSMAEKGYEVSILIFYHTNDEYSYSNKIKIISISDSGIHEYKKNSNIDLIVKFRKIIKETNPQKIFCFLSKTSVITFISTLFTKFQKRVVFTVRANPNMDNSKIGRLHKFLYRFVKKTIVQNEGQKNCFPKGVQNKTIVIPNPMYDEMFLYDKQYSKEAKNIVSVGRLTSQKNYELSINAIEKLYANHPNINYYIYGEGPLKSKLSNLITEKSLDNVIHIMGFEKDRKIIYGDKDIFLMTSKYEGMPNSLAEAMCMGIPVISTDCDFGPRDLIMNKDMGILLNDFEIDTLVNELTNVINDYNSFIEKAIHSQNILKEKYGFNKIVDMWEKVVEGD